MGAVDALKGIHEIGEYNALISFILVIVLCITFLELLQKIKSIMGIKFKGDLEKETLDHKLIELDHYMGYMILAILCLSNMACCV